MNENLIQVTGPMDTNIPETIGPSVSEPTDLPAELKQQQQYQSGYQSEEQSNQELEAAEEAIRETASRPLKKDEYKNAARLRLQLEQAQRERDEALRRLQEKSENVLGDDDLAEGKHLNRVQREIKALKEELVQTRIKAQYHDFDSVVTMDNLALLRDSYPELAATLQSSPDLYTQASSAYTLIKKLGIAPDVQEVANRARVAQNMTKPRSAVSVGPQQGESPLTKANAFAEGLTDDLKKQMVKEMNQARKGY
jgi:hypothetical protein